MISATRSTDPPTRAYMASSIADLIWMVEPFAIVGSWSREVFSKPLRDQSGRNKNRT